MPNPRIWTNEEIQAASNEWWEDHLTSSEDGGMHVIVYAMCALSGGIVGLIIGLLIG